MCKTLRSSVVEGTNENGEVNTLTLAASKVTTDIAVKLTLTFTHNAILQTITHDVFGKLVLNNENPAIYK